MAELRLEQLKNLLDKDYTFTWVTWDERTGLYDKVETRFLINPIKNKKPNEVLRNVKNTKTDILNEIQNIKHKLGTNMLLEKWDLATIPESRAIGYNAIRNDLQRRMRIPQSAIRNYLPSVPNDAPYQSQIRSPSLETQEIVDYEKIRMAYLELVYTEFHDPKQFTITSTFKEKLTDEKLRSDIELQTLQAQLGIAQKSLETEILERESAKLDFQESHLGLLSFNKLINKIEELHEPEPVKTGFDLGSIDAKKLLVVGLGLIGVVILLIVVKK